MYQLDVDTQEKQLEKKDEFPSGPGNDSAATPDSPATAPRQHITFAPSQPRNDDSPLYIPGPRERDMGAPLRVLSKSDLSKSAGESLSLSFPSICPRLPVDIEC
jgi:hypothetical protein